MTGAEVTSKVVNVHHTVNGQDIVLPERVNEVGTFATIFGAGKYSELIWALIIVAGVQVLLFGVLPLVLLPWTWANFRTLTADPRLRAAVCLYALPFTFFLYKAARGPLEATVLRIRRWEKVVTLRVIARTRIPCGVVVGFDIVPESVSGFGEIHVRKDAKRVGHVLVLQIE